MARTAKNPSIPRAAPPAGEPGIVELYRRMLLMRRIGEQTSPPPVEAGAEAVAAGAISALSAADHLVATPAHQGACLALASHVRGGASRAAIADAIERGIGLSKGNEPSAILCLIDDGAIAESAFGEYLGRAASLNLPIVFVCENNFCGLGTQFDGPDCQEALYAFARSHGLAAVRVDGCEVLAVYLAVKSALCRARAGGGASLVDAVTYYPRAERGFDRAGAIALHHPHFWHQRDPLEIARAAILTDRALSARRLRDLEREAGRAAAALLAGANAAGDSAAGLRRCGE